MFDFLKATPQKRSVKINNKSGVIFHNLRGLKKFLFNFGTAIILTSLVFFVYLYQPLFMSWLNYKQINQQPNNQLISNNRPTLIPAPTNLPTPKPTVTIVVEETVDVEENKDFKIEIPKIGAKADIIIDVSPIDKNQYLKVLENNNIAHSNLSALPGNGKGSTTYLFAHSTQQSIQTVRKNSVFYLLGELGQNDKVLVNYRGQNIEYKVYMKKVISAKESEYLTYSEVDKEVLILQTCWPIGTNWKRLLVFAERI
jgi:LPXTG-site transpeptidase (sortase) family protein